MIADLMPAPTLAELLKDLRRSVEVMQNAPLYGKPGHVEGIIQRVDSLLAELVNRVEALEQCQTKTSVL